MERQWKVKEGEEKVTYLDDPDTCWVERKEVKLKKRIEGNYIDGERVGTKKKDKRVT